LADAAYFHVLADGLSCARHKKPNSGMLGRDALMLAQRMLREPIRAISNAEAGEVWPRQRGQDLRRFLVRTLERHIERRLNSAAAIGRLGG
jgi:DNA repair protein RecO (recombination protein O)